MNTEKSPDISKLSILLQLEAMARDSETVKALQFLIVNETRKLIPFRQAFLFSPDKKHKDIYRLQAASSVSVVDSSSRLTRWLEKTLISLFKEVDLNKIEYIDSKRCPESARKGWDEYSLPFVLWCPLLLKDGTQIGGLWLAREKPWQDNEVTLIKRLADTYAHAWYALLGPRKLSGNTHYERISQLSVLFIIACFLFIPVRITALAPVEVVAKDPVIISAPMNGVIADIKLPPNSMIENGDTVFVYEDTDLRNKFEIAEKSLLVAKAELHKSTQQAFQDNKSRAEIAFLQAEVELRLAERAYAKELLDQVTIKAPADGLLIYSDKSDWIGRPINVGEHIMQIARPSIIKFRIDLPVKDSIFLVEGSEAKIYLDVDPLHSIPAIVTHTSYEAKVTPEEVLVYKVDAEWIDPEYIPRIGLQGTAKIYGERVSLFFYLFRRPLAAIRQFIGI